MDRGDAQKRTTSCACFHRSVQNKKMVPTRWHPAKITQPGKYYPLPTSPYRIRSVGTQKRPRGFPPFSHHMTAHRMFGMPPVAYVYRVQCSSLSSPTSRQLLTFPDGVGGFAASSTPRCWVRNSHVPALIGDCLETTFDGKTSALEHCIFVLCA